jgi:hypothetical protein
MHTTTPDSPRLTPGQTTYVIERLTRERRLTTTQINQYLNDHEEIATIEARLAIPAAAITALRARLDT